MKNLAGSLRRSSPRFVHLFGGFVAQIMEQKWIANFATASESYLDWRRTGLPDLQTGPFALSSVIPVRFQYPDEERNINVKTVKNFS